jgi:hypothetical protein
LFVGQLPVVDRLTREVWALDGTAWPRPQAATSSERTWEYHPVAGTPQKHLVPAWEYQWLVGVPEATGSWVLPLDLRRRSPGGGTPTELAIQQVRSVLAKRPPAAPRPVVTLDSGYAPGELAQAQLAADLLVRLPRRRRLFRAPGPYRGRGAPRKHGAVFKLHDARTHGLPDHTCTAEDPVYGHVTVAVWTQLHDQPFPSAPFRVVRVQVAHLPHQARAPEPLWLAWIGGPLPDDLRHLWRWYQRRFTVEHAFRFCKHTLGWTTIRPRAPAAGDRWTWLIAATLWQLWLARARVADDHLPWERPCEPTRLTPGRVRRAFVGFLTTLGSPTRAPHTRGKAPGRRPGHSPGPRQRFAVAHRKPAHDRRCHCPHHRRHLTAA